MTIDGYLIDTNIVSYLTRAPEDTKRQSVKAKLDALPEGAPLFISVISLGEIRYGWQVQVSERLRDSELSELKRFEVLKVTKHTSTPYAEIRARLFSKFSPKQSRSKGMRPEQLKNPITGLELGIQENDLWLAAQASEHNLVLVTGDKMNRIRQVVELDDTLRFQNWSTDV